MWHQLTGYPESYRELTATSMIAVAMMRGLRSGWLRRRRYEAATGRAWYALRSRIAPSGELVDSFAPALVSRPARGLTATARPFWAATRAAGPWLCWFRSSEPLGNAITNKTERRQHRRARHRPFPER